MSASANTPLKVLLISNHRRFKIGFRALPWAREMARRGHDVDILCHANTERFKTHIEQCDGFRIIENPDMLVGALRQGWDPYCSQKRKAFLFRENKQYDIIHCLDTRLAVIWPAIAYGRAKGIPIVSDWIDWWGRGGLIKERRPWWYQGLFGAIETWFEEHYRADLDGLTTISHALRDRGVKLGCDPDRCMVIHGGADMDVFANVPSKEDAKKELQVDADTPIVCFSGLDVLIDLPLAIKAFDHIIDQVPEARLLLVGPTAELARQLAPNDRTLTRILALGPVPHADLPKHLAAADVFLMPYTDKQSNWGRWPNKVGDYMSVGRPVVSNAIGEVKWLMGEYDIGLLADETPESMGDALLQLLNDPDRCETMGREGRRVAEEVFAWDKMIVNLEQWYYDILEREKEVR